MGLAALLPTPHDASAPPAFLPADIDAVIHDFRTALAGSSFAPDAFAPYEDFLRTFLAPTTAPTLDTLARYPDVRDLVLARPDPRSLTAGPAAIILVAIANPTNDALTRDAAASTLRDAVRKIPGATVTGMAVVGHDVEHAVRQDLPRFLIAASIAVVAILLLCLRSIKYTLLSLIPLVFGGLVLLAVMAITRERLNLANTMAVPLLLGIGVDYGIFLVVLAQQSERNGESREQVAGRFKASFHAIAHTALTSFIGFGTLVVTTTPAVQSLGRVIAIGVFASLVGALAFLAPLLLVLVPRQGHQARHAAPSAAGPSSGRPV
jgi:predicted RND superfamily exporter protein